MNKQQQGVVLQGSPRYAPRYAPRLSALGMVSLFGLALLAGACGPKAGGTGDKPMTTQGAPAAGGAGGTGGDTGGGATPTSPGTAPSSTP